MSEPHPPSQVLPPSDGEGVAAPKYLRAQERRAATIEAVLQLAACTHPSELSTTRIAQHMGVTQGALFKHFPSKEALLEATMAWVAQQLLARIEQAAQEPLARGDCLAALQAVFLAHIGFAAEHPGVPRILFGELQRSESSASRQVVQNLLGQYGQRLQQWLGPDVWWLSVSNLFGSGGFQLALIPLLLPLLGWPRLRQLLFAMLWLGLLVQASKEGIGWPRPFHLQPELATQSAQGFGMPSGHTASALLFWGALLGWLWPARRGLAYSLALLLALTTGLARVWLGVHFISDVAVGLLIGALLLAVRPYWRLDQCASAWGLLIAAALVCAGLTQSAHLTGIGMAAFGLWVGGLLTLTRGGYPPIVTGAVTLAGGAVIGAGLWALPLLTSSSLAILLGQFVLFFGLGLWLSAGLWWILSFLKCDTRPKGNGSDKGTL